mgnify:CR=1 FL=1
MFALTGSERLALQAGFVGIATVVIFKRYTKKYRDRHGWQNTRLQATGGTIPHRLLFVLKYQNGKF